MRVSGIMVERIDETRILLEIVRNFACGGECHACGNCSGHASRIIVECKEEIFPGERAVVSIAKHRYFWISFLVFLLPLGGMLAGYFVIFHWLGEKYAPFGALFLGAGLFVGIILKMRRLKMPRAIKEREQC